MALYLIAFNDEWVPDLTPAELRERGTSVRAVIEEMKVAGVFVFSDGGLGASTAVCSVDPRSGSPVFTDGPLAETGEHLGGFAVVDVPGDEQARYWAGRIAVAVGWPQEVHRFPHRPLSADAQPEALSPAAPPPPQKSIRCHPGAPGRAFCRDCRPAELTRIPEMPVRRHRRHNGPVLTIFGSKRQLRYLCSVEL